jgi:hypothetical protein
MGIATRKSGSVVRCPKCSGQVVVPATSEAGSVTPPPASRRSAASSPTTAETASDAPFDFGSIEILPPESGNTDIEVVPLTGSGPVSGVFLTVKHLLLAGILIFVLVISAFFLGWFLGRR